MADRNGTVAPELGPGHAMSSPDVSAFCDLRLAVSLEDIYQRFLRDPNHDSGHWALGNVDRANVDRASALVGDEAE
jgi:hypothetical protein